MGWIDKGEAPITASKGELAEETGYKSITKPKNYFNFIQIPEGTLDVVFVFTRKI